MTEDNNRIDGIIEEGEEGEESRKGSSPQPIISDPVSSSPAVTSKESIVLPFNRPLCKSDKKINRIYQESKEKKTKGRKPSFEEKQAAYKSREPGVSGPPKTVGYYTDEELALTLNKYDGLQSLTAEKLGISAVGLNIRIKNSPYLQEAMAYIKERRLDKSEDALFKNIDYDKNIDAIKFHLKTQGKKRGYVERLFLGSDDESPLTINIVPVIQSLTDKQINQPIQERQRLNPINEVNTYLKEEDKADPVSNFNIEDMAQEGVVLGNRIVEPKEEK